MSSRVNEPSVADRCGLRAASDDERPGTHSKRIIRFKDGQVRSDEPVLHQRVATEELAKLPVLEEEEVSV